MTRLSLLRIAILSIAIAVLLGPALAVVAQSTGVQATVTVDVANVRSGPGTNYPVIGQLRQGAVLSLAGRNSANNWWYGCCVNGKNGWISNTVARANGNTGALPVVNAPGPQPAPTAQPTPTPAPASYPDWKGEYFNDINLAGPPLMVRNDPHLDFNWGLGSPDPRVPADNFSVRWTRSVNFAGGNYLFQARTSDGVRIYLDKLLVMNEWRDTVGYPTYTAPFNDLGAGWHTVTVEYYERGGIAYATVWWNQMTAPQ